MMVRRLRNILCGALVVLVSCAWGAEPFTIARGGAAKVVIRISPKAAPSVHFAAQELVKYLGEMTGAKFRIVSGGKGGAAICVEEITDATAKSEEIRLKVKDSTTLLLMGEGPRGPIYAVYAFLERIGCGFWAPDNETVPTVRNLSVAGDLDVTEAPAFELRDPSGISTWFSPEWRVKCAVNSGAYRPIPDEMGGFRPYDFAQNKLGLEGSTSDFAAHPEWYALRNGGKRSRQHLCNANVGVRAEIIRRIRERMAKNPDLRQIALGLNDGFEFCQCAACSRLRTEEGGQIGPELDLANFVAAELAAEFPRLRYLIFAYESSLRPPKKLKPHPSVDVCIAALSGRNFARPPSGTRGLADIITEWGRLTRGHVYVWSYNAQWRNFIAPWPTVALLGLETREYRDFGVRGLFYQMSDGTISDFCDLRAWLAAKMMWNPDRDEMKLMETWCKGACGKGGPYVMEWLKMCRKIRERSKSFGAYQGETRTIMTAAETLAGDALLAKAEEATKGDARTHNQVRKIRASTLAALVCRYNGDAIAEAKKRGKTLPPRTALLSDLDERARQFKCGAFAEGWGWTSAFLSRIRHGEVEPEKPGDGPRMRGAWTFRNPVAAGTEEDPFIVHDAPSGFYYRIRTVGDELRLRRTKRAIALFDEDCEEVVAWKADCRSLFVGSIRGAELLRGTDGRWRIYASGADSENERRLFVLEGGKEAFGKFRFATRLLPKETAADPTVFTMPDGKPYLFYARERGKMGLVVRPLTSPLKPGAREGVILPAKDAKECVRSPSLVQMGRELYLLYEACGQSAADSEIRALKFRGGDPCAAKSWEQCPRSVIRSGNAFHNADTVLVGPRAPAIFTSADRTEKWIAFRGWTRQNPSDAAKESITCIQRLDDGFDLGSLFFETGAELRILLIQPSGDFDPTKIE